MRVDAPSRPHAPCGHAAARRQQRVGGVCIAILVIAALVAVFGPPLAPHDPNAVNLLQRLRRADRRPSAGLRRHGRDLFSRLLVGARTSMLGPLVVVISVLSGRCWQSPAPGWAAVFGTCMDVLFAFPGILFAVLTTAVFGASLTAAAIALSIAYTPYVARVLRAAALRERASSTSRRSRCRGSRVPSAPATWSPTSPS